MGDVFNWLSFNTHCCILYSWFIFTGWCDNAELSGLINLYIDAPISKLVK